MDASTAYNERVCVLPYLPYIYLPLTFFNITLSARRACIQTLRLGSIPAAFLFEMP